MESANRSNGRFGLSPGCRHTRKSDADGIPFGLTGEQVRGRAVPLGSAVRHTELERLPTQFNVALNVAGPSRGCSRRRSTEPASRRDISRGTDTRSSDRPSRRATNEASSRHRRTERRDLAPKHSDLLELATERASPPPTADSSSGTGRIRLCDRCEAAKNDEQRGQ